MLINIDGWFAGGKSVLWSLLDGHPDVFVNPVHDYSFSLLLTHDDHEEWVKKKYCTTLRKTLALAEYFKLEKIMYDGYLPIHFSTDVHYKLPFNFDFYLFDRLFMESLHRRDKWNISDIIDDLYESLRIVWQNNAEIPKPKYYASMSHPRFFTHYHKIPQLVPGMKSILIKRDIRNIVATRTNRKERPRDLNEHQAFRTPFNKVIQSQEIAHIHSFFEAYDRLSLEYPDHFLIVEFSKVISNTESEMRRVADFLGINYLPVLSIPTRDGVLLEHDGVSFIGTENDTWDKLLTEEEQLIVTAEIDRVSKGGPRKYIDYSSNYAVSATISRAYSTASIALQGFKRIAIYGNSTAGRFFAAQFQDRVVAIFDRAATERAGLVIPLSDINSIGFDVVLVAVLGREQEVIADLVNFYQVPEEKIVTLLLS